MPTSTTNLSFQLPIVGSDTNAWGGYLNANWTALDALLWGSATIRPDLAAGLWEIGGVAVTSTAAELNKLASSTATAVEINYLTGVTSAVQTQLNARQPLNADLTAITGLATPGLVARTGAGTAEARTVTGTANQITVTNGDGAAGNPTIAASVASEAEAQAGADTTKLMTSQRTAQAITAQASPILTFSAATATTSGVTHTISGIPSTAREVEIYLREVAMSASGQNFLVQVVDTGTTVTSGYKSAGESATSVAGFTIQRALSSREVSGIMRLVRTETGVWVQSHSVSAEDFGWSGGGSVTGITTLTGITLVGESGGTFTGGALVISWR